MGGLRERGGLRWLAPQMAPRDLLPLAPPRLPWALKLPRPSYRCYNSGHLTLAAAAERGLPAAAHSGSGHSLARFKVVGGRQVAGGGPRRRGGGAGRRNEATGRPWWRSEDRGEERRERGGKERKEDQS
ncbi:hypothetical protein PAHAL_3G394200 [Panicum hallii]|uniref:Uncharacterized protein n=1 Tax=Panicum hallii TaxID=206008 RepID=A0A2T8KKT5_9POAL|nr:hypothetical protein PAHAL_3G394200 [Panicum hallii]